jgi:hypothetical protein
LAQTLYTLTVRLPCRECGTPDEAADALTPSSSLPFHPAAVRPVSLSLSCFPNPIHTQLPLHRDHQLDNLGVAIGIISSLLTRPHSHCLRSPASVPEQDHPQARSRLECARLRGPEGNLSTTSPCQSCVFTTVERKTPTSLGSCLSTGPITRTRRLFWHRTSPSPPLSVTQRNSFPIASQDPFANTRPPFVFRIAKGRKNQRERGHVRIYASRGHALGATRCLPRRYAT